MACNPSSGFKANAHFGKPCVISLKAAPLHQTLTLTLWGPLPSVSLILNPLAHQQWLDERAVVGVGVILRKASGPAHMHVTPLPNCRPV